MSSRVCAVSSGRTPDGKRWPACRGCSGWVEYEMTMEKVCFEYNRVDRRINPLHRAQPVTSKEKKEEAQVRKEAGGRGVIF